MTISNHASKRFRSRVNIPKSDMYKTVKMALYKGITHKQCTGRLKQYMNYLYLSHKNGSNMRIYDHYIYIFTYGDVLVTILPLPIRYYNIVTEIEESLNRAS